MFPFFLVYHTAFLFATYGTLEIVSYFSFTLREEASKNIRLYIYIFKLGPLSSYCGKCLVSDSPTSSSPSLDCPATDPYRLPGAGILSLLSPDACSFSGSQGF